MNREANMLRTTIFFIIFKQVAKEFYGFIDLFIY